MADVKELIKGCGGVFATKVGDEVTHLVATPAQFSKNGAKVKDASNYPDIRIVDFEWLNNSLSSKSKIDEDGYLLDPTQEDAVIGSDTLVAASTASKKRRRADDDDDPPAPTNLKKSKVMQKDGQKAKSRSMNIPVDEHCPSQQNYRVYVNDAGMIFDATLNQTNSGNNNNKFYRLQVILDGQSYYTWTRWGRVGITGQSKMLGDGTLASALKNFHAKFKDKNGGLWDDRHNIARPGKYNFLELSYEDSSNEDNDDLPGAGRRRASKESTESTHSEQVESKLPGPVQRLMKLIFNQQYFDDTLASLDYDTNKMPLGKLSKRTLLRGYEVLKELAALVQNPNIAPASNTGIGAVTDLSNTYLSLIPHAFGMRRAPILQNMATIKKEIDLLETLTDMQLANDIMKSAKGNKDQDGQSNVMDRQYQGLGMGEMTPLDLTSIEAVELSAYLSGSAGATHHMQYSVQDIFRIERQGENDRFAQSEYSRVKNSDRRLLWHGSRATNFGGILSQGLRIAPPEAPVSGYAFGKGIYLADVSTKSAGYCDSYSSGNIALLLLCEAELGRPPLKLTNADYNAGERAKEAKCISTWGVGQTSPASWKDASSVHTGLKGVKMPDVKQAPGPSNEENAYLLYNEYIVYDVAQIRLRYLFRVEMK